MCDVNVGPGVILVLNSLIYL